MLYRIINADICNILITREQLYGLAYLRPLEMAVNNS